MNIGTAHVDLQPAHLRLFIELFTGIGVVIHRKAAHVSHDRLIKAFFQLRQLLCDYLFHSRILQAYSVYHSRRTLGDTRSRISEARLLRSALERKGTEDIYVIQLCELISVPEGARSGDNGVIKLDTAQIHTQSAHSISSLFSTGPSLHIRLYPVSVLHEQPIQAPKPQPIRSSKLNCPEVLTALFSALNIGIGPQV